MDSAVPASCTVNNAATLNTNIGPFSLVSTATVNELFTASAAPTGDPGLEDPTAAAAAGTGGTAAAARHHHHSEHHSLRAKLRDEGDPTDTATTTDPTVGNNQVMFTHTVGINENIVRLTAFNITENNVPGADCSSYVAAAIPAIPMVVSTKGPSLISFSSRTLNNSNITVGGIVRIFCTFSRPITYSTFFGCENAKSKLSCLANDALILPRTPVLLLNSGGIAQLEGYGQQGVNHSDSLMFRYSVGLGESAPRLDVTSFILNQVP